MLFRSSRVGASVPVGLEARKFRPVGVIGPFGAAAAAAAILGDGSVALILDVAQLVVLAQSRSEKQSKAA